MPSTRKTGYGPIVVALAPATLFVALVAHPYIAGRLPNDAAVAAAVAADTTRWGLVHLAAGLASGLLILAFLAVRDYLRDAGDHGLSAVGVPFVVIGSTLFVMLPAMEFAPLVAAEAAGTDLADIAAAQAALEEWFVPVMMAGGLTFAIGVFAFIRSIATTGILRTPLTAVVVAALAVMALSRLVPLAAAQLYLHSAAAILAFWPLAHHMWRHPRPGAAARPARARESQHAPTCG